MTIDRVTSQYNEESRAPGSGLASAARRVEDFPTLAARRGAYLPRPLFVAERQLRDFAADTVSLVELLTALPRRLFDGDTGRFCAALGVGGPKAALMRRLGDAPPPHNGRADMYHDGESFKLLEFGIASEVGGWDRAGEIPRALLEAPEFADFAARNDLGYTHPAHAVVRTLRQVGATVAPGREPVVALLEWRGGLADYGSTWRTFQEVLRWAGLDILVAEVTDVRERDGGLYLGDKRIDMVYRCFEVNQVTDEPGGLDLVEPIFRAHEAGGIVLWTPMSSNLFNNKGCMALLSDPRHRTRFTERERALIDRVLPWTRVLNEDAVRADDGLIDRCRERRERLILKPSGYYGGLGTVVGWESDDHTWRQALKEGTIAGCVVQERVVPRPEPVVNPDTGETEEWQAVWGLFYTPEGYAGAYGRAVPPGCGGVIGLSANQKTRTAGVFHYRDQPREQGPAR